MTQCHVMLPKKIQYFQLCMMEAMDATSLDLHSEIRVKSETSSNRFFTKTLYVILWHSSLSV